MTFSSPLVCVCVCACLSASSCEGKSREGRGERRRDLSYGMIDCENLRIYHVREGL